MGEFIAAVFFTLVIAAAASIIGILLWFIHSELKF